MRFELIDSVIERDGERIVALKSVTAAEEYLADHFPGFPVLPGVMMLEAMIQAGRRLLAERDAGPWVLAEVRSVRYGSMVRPGQQLELTVERKKEQGGGAHLLAGRGTVEEQVAVQGRFALRRAEAAAR